MGDMWRSQKMTLCQLIVQNDAAHAVVNKLGQVGMVEFRDLNAGTSFYKRSFVEEVRKCDELDRILRGVKDEYAEAEITPPEKDDKLSLALSLDDIEDKIKEVDDELSGLKSTQEVPPPSPDLVHHLRAPPPPLALAVAAAARSAITSHTPPCVASRSCC